MQHTQDVSLLGTSWLCKSAWVISSEADGNVIHVGHTYPTNWYFGQMMTKYQGNIKVVTVRNMNLPVFKKCQHACIGWKVGGSEIVHLVDIKIFPWMNEKLAYLWRLMKSQLPIHHLYYLSSEGREAGSQSQPTLEKRQGTPWTDHQSKADKLRGPNVKSLHRCKDP